MRSESLISPPASAPTRWLSHPGMLSLWCVAAAFGTYACMYGFRKPFTAGTYLDAESGASFKTWLVTAQVLGYTVSKFIGIRVIAEMPPERRTGFLLALIGAAELALLLFAITPAPYNAGCLFLNGLPLGMVFGLVLGFLEGRRLTEAFVAGLCASFILADGVTKSVGAGLLRWGIPEPWMPAAAGLVFLVPLVGFVWMLRQIPPPTAADIAARSARVPMGRKDRSAFLRQHGLGLGLITSVYLLVTILRSLRADFAPELWAELGTTGQPGVFTRSELWVTLGVVLGNGLIVFVQDNRQAFFGALALSAGGLLLVMAAVLGVRLGGLDPFAFMVLVGLGLYLPYVAVHTTVFERLMALTRDPGNIGFLMYLADAVGYLGYVTVMLVRRAGPVEGGLLDFFLHTALAAAVLSLLALAGVAHAFRAPTVAARHPLYSP